MTNTEMCHKDALYRRTIGKLRRQWHYCDVRDWQSDSMPAGGPHQVVGQEEGNDSACLPDSFFVINIVVTISNP